MSEAFWSQTYDGRKFRYDDVTANEYALEDIAHHLAMTNRYGGACVYPFSVAQHSCALAQALHDMGQPATVSLYALFHDAAEAYVGDVRTPLKDHMYGFRTIEDKILDALLTDMNLKGIPVPMGAPARMKEWDRRIVLDERKAGVMKPCIHKWYGLEGLQPLGADPALFVEMPWKVAENLWLTMVRIYTDRARTERCNVIPLKPRRNQ